MEISIQRLSWALPFAQVAIPTNRAMCALSGNTMTLALSREPGRATWITRRDYEFNV